jgi:hypothetical protein
VARGRKNGRELGSVGNGKKGSTEEELREETKRGRGAPWGMKKKKGEEKGR